MARKQAHSYDELTELVKRAQTGDQEAFREVYRRTAQVQYFKLCGKVSAEAAADILQDAYLSAWRNIGNINPRAFVGYLSTTVHHLCADYYDRANRRPETMLSYDDLASPDGKVMGKSLVDHRDDPVRETLRHDENNQLAQALRAALDDREREAILLRFYQDMPLATIADALDISESTVKRTIRRALEKLRNALGDLPRGAFFPVALAQVVETPLAPGAAPRPISSRHARAADRASRVVAAVAVIGAVGVAYTLERPQASEPEVLEEVDAPATPLAEPTAEVRETNPPVLASVEFKWGLTVLTLTDETGIAEVRLVDEAGGAHEPVEAEPVANAEDVAGLVKTVYRFEVPSGTYTARAADTLGNQAEGTVTVTAPPSDL